MKFVILGVVALVIAELAVRSAWRKRIERMKKTARGVA